MNPYDFLFSASLGPEISGPRDLCSPLHPGTYKHKHVYNKWVSLGGIWYKTPCTATDMYCWKVKLKHSGSG